MVSCPYCEHDEPVYGDGEENPEQECPWHDTIWMEEEELIMGHVSPIGKEVEKENIRVRSPKAWYKKMKKLR